METILKTIGAAFMLLYATQLFAENENFTYESIAKRHANVRLDKQSVEAAKMQGECLIGLKELNFQKREDFDPLSEWTNYRSISLLEQFPPLYGADNYGGCARWFVGIGG